MKSSILLLTLLSISPLMAMDPSSRSVYPGHQTRQTTQDKSLQSGVYHEPGRMAGQVKKQVVNGQDQEFAAQQESKRCQAQNEVLDEDSWTRRILETNAKEAKRLEDACAILFTLKEKNVDYYKKVGLPQRLQNTVFGYLEEMLCVKTLEGHKDAETITVIPLTANGKQLLGSGSYDATIRLWYPITGQNRGALINNIYGKQLIACASGNKIDLIDSVSGKRVETLSTWGDVVCLKNVTTANGNQLLASELIDGTIQLWSYSPGNFEKAVIHRKNFQNARAILQELPNPDGGNGLPEKLRQLIAEYIDLTKEI